MESKYILNAIPYLDKDQSRPSTQKLSDNAVMTLMEPFMGKDRNVTTDNFFTSFLLAKELKKNTGLVAIMNKVRCELPASAKCLRQGYSGKLMKAGDMATLIVYQGRPRKTFVFLVFCIYLLSLANLRKRNRRQWNFVTRSNVVFTWLIKWSGSIQSKQAPVGGPLLFTTTFSI